MHIIRKIALILTIVGALNWGLIGIFNINLVTLIFKSNMIATILYIIIGIASLVSITYLLEKEEIIA